MRREGTGLLELRRHQRTRVSIALEFVAKDSNGPLPGRARDISLGGMFVETAEPLPFSTDLVVYITLPGQKTRLALPAVVRWIGSDGMGIQFRLLGARETHAITELTKRR